MAFLSIFPPHFDRLKHIQMSHYCIPLYQCITLSTGFGSPTQMTRLSCYHWKQSFWHALSRNCWRSAHDIRSKWEETALLNCQHFNCASFCVMNTVSTISATRKWLHVLVLVVVTPIGGGSYGMMNHGSTFSWVSWSLLTNCLLWFGLHGALQIFDC